MSINIYIIVNCFFRQNNKKLLSFFTNICSKVSKKTQYNFFFILKSYTYKRNLGYVKKKIE